MAWFCEEMIVLVSGVSPWILGFHSHLEAQAICRNEAFGVSMIRNSRHFSPST
jgi:hypothetical protein